MVLLLINPEKKQKFFSEKELIKLIIKINKQIKFNLQVNIEILEEEKNLNNVKEEKNKI